MGTRRSRARWTSGESVVTVLALVLIPTQLVGQVPVDPSDHGGPPGSARAPALPGLDLFVPSAGAASPTADVVELGRRLFFDPALSRDSTVACATCHQPERAFADDRSVSRGAFGRVGERNVPTLVNRVWGRSFFWDGRVRELKDQVLRPLVASVEMDMTVDESLARLREDPSYVAAFERAFGDGPSEDRLAEVLAAYVGTIRAGDSPFDRFAEGDRSALDDREQLGLELFQGRGGCVRCHTGPLLTDESFHNTGVAWPDGVPLDLGRFIVTGEPEDLGAFKTPSLREVARTAPYMHDGSVDTLAEVVDFYDRGGNPNRFLDPRLRPLQLDDEEKSALVAFLEALTGTVTEGLARPD